VKYKAPKSMRRSGKPVKKVSAAKKKRSVPGARQYLIRGWWILRGAAAGALVLVALYGAYLGFGKVSELESLSVKTIEVDGCQEVRPESIRRLSGVGEGDPLLRVDLKRVRQRVITHPRVKDATVVRELPNTLRISVHERISAAVILDRQFALVDAEGVVLSILASYPEGFPLITGVSEPLEPGRMIAGAVPAMKVLRTISSSGFIGPERISELRVDGDTVQVSLMNSGTVLVLGHGDTGTQAKKLARLMEAGVFDARSAGYDLRFDGRVVGMAEGKSDVKRGMGLSPAGG